MNRHRALVSVTLGASLVALLMACTASSTHPAAAGSGGTSGTLGGGSSGTPDAGADASSDSAAADSAAPTCVAIAHNGSPVSEIMNNAPPPDPVGGTLTPGTYDLKNFDAYDPSIPAAYVTGRTSQASLVLTATSITITSLIGDADGGAPVETTAAWTYQVQGTTALVRTPVCPPGAPATPISFSAVGGALSLFPDVSHRELYQLRP